jgi:hypothetical protein
MSQSRRYLGLVRLSWQNLFMRTHHPESLPQPDDLQIEEIIAAYLLLSIATLIVARFVVNLCRGQVGASAEKRSRANDPHVPFIKDEVAEVVAIPPPPKDTQTMLSGSVDVVKAIKTQPDPRLFLAAAARLPRARQQMLAHGCHSAPLTSS